MGRGLRDESFYLLYTPAVVSMYHLELPGVGAVSGRDGARMATDGKEAKRQRGTEAKRQRGKECTVETGAEET